jgi:hypothetical protein
MKKILSILIASVAILSFNSFAEAATPKAGAVCTTKDARAKIGNVYFHCAVVPAKWASSTQMVWQNEEQWSSSIDKLLSGLDPKTRYQYCITQMSGILPGKKGDIPQSALMACQNLPGAPKSTSTTSTSSSQTASTWPSYVTPSFISCLGMNGFKPKDMNELMMSLTDGKNDQAFKACKALAPDIIASRIK